MLCDRLWKHLSLKNKLRSYAAWNGGALVSAVDIVVHVDAVPHLSGSMLVI